jgi:hypothetical protein
VTMTDEHDDCPLDPKERRQLERYLRKRFRIKPGTSFAQMCEDHREAVVAWAQEEADKAKREVQLAAHQYAIAEAQLAVFWTWAEDERAKGRPESELLLGNCQRELGIVDTKPDGSLVLVLERLLDWPQRLHRLRSTRDPETYSPILTKEAEAFERRFGNRQ